MVPLCQVVESNLQFLQQTIVWKWQRPRSKLYVIHSMHKKLLYVARDAQYYSVISFRLLSWTYIFQETSTVLSFYTSPQIMFKFSCLRLPILSHSPLDPTNLISPTPKNESKKSISIYLFLGWSIFSNTPIPYFILILCDFQDSSLVVIDLIVNIHIWVKTYCIFFLFVFLCSRWF